MILSFEELIFIYEDYFSKRNMTDNKFNKWLVSKPNINQDILNIWKKEYKGALFDDLNDISILYKDHKADFKNNLDAVEFVRLMININKRRDSNNEIHKILLKKDIKNFSEKLDTPSIYEAYESSGSIKGISI